MASFNYGFDVDTNVNSDTDNKNNNFGGRINLAADVDNELKIAPKAEDERAHSPTLLQKEISIDDNDSLHEYIDIELKKRSPFANIDTPKSEEGKQIDNNENNGPYYSMPPVDAHVDDTSTQKSEKVPNINTPNPYYKNSSVNAEITNDIPKIENDNSKDSDNDYDQAGSYYSIPPKEESKKIEVGKPIIIVLQPDKNDKPSNNIPEEKNIRNKTDAVDAGEYIEDSQLNLNAETDLNKDEPNLSSYENLTLKVNEPDTTKNNNNNNNNASYESFPFSKSTSSRRPNRTSDSSMSSIQRDYEMVNSTTVDYLNELPRNNNNRVSSKGTRRDTNQSYDEIDLGTHIEPAKTSTKHTTPNTSMGKLKGKIPHGFAYVIRPIGALFMINVIFSLIIPAVIFTWEEKPKNDFYADSRIEAMMGISVYVCVCLFLQVIIGVVAKQKSRVHLLIFIHTIIMIILILAASVCVSVVAQEIRDDDNCSINDCDSLIVVSVLGFLLMLFLIFQAIFYWLDLRTFGYRCECCIEVFRIEE